MASFCPAQYYFFVSQVFKAFIMAACVCLVSVLIKTVSSKLCCVEIVSVTQWKNGKIRFCESDYCSCT